MIPRLRLHVALSLVILALISGLSIQPAQTADGWEPVAAGIDYQQFHVNGPNNVYVARMDRSNPNVTLESMTAYGRLSGGRETISSMARRSDQAINYWGGAWGARNKVVVAINGDFENSTLVVPTRGQFLSGWYSKRFSDKQNGSGFAWTMDRQAFIGECISHPVAQQIVTFADGEISYFQGINVPRGDSQLVVYTPQYDGTTETDNSGTEVVVELTSPLMMLGSQQPVVGVIRDVRRGQGSTPIPFDAIVLSGQGLNNGTAGFRLGNHANVGDEIRIAQEIRNFSEWNCTSEIDGFSWARTYASIGGSFYFLKDYDIQRENDSGANIRNPRTAIAFNDEYIFFIVVDGRNPGVSVGMTMSELGKFAKGTLGARYGINQDGGGSSEMVVNGVVVNFPSDGLPRSTVVPQANSYSVFMPFIGSGAGSSTTTPKPPSGKIVERPVVNGMLMVVVEPEAQSGTFAAGDAVTVIASTDLRLGPGTNYYSLASVAQGTSGTILSHSLDGVLAKGAHWWKVDFGGGIEGWMPEDALGR